MNNWRACLLGEGKRVIDAVKVIDNSIAKIAIVVDDDGALVGTVTDYDVRQAVLRGESMDVSVKTIMNSSPKYVSNTVMSHQMRAAFEQENVRQLPIVDERGVVVDVALQQDFVLRRQKRSNPVLLMAGGLGTRLRPLTDSCPKPLLKIGSRPILEIILESFIEAGFSDFYISVNYKAEMIKEYFGDGSKFGVRISYLQEDKRMGTAGALSLLPHKLTEPLIVMNGDLLTKVDFNQLLEFHNKHRAVATMCVREYRYQVPYGVVRFDNWRIEALEEKPEHIEFVNAGIYVLNTEFYSDIQKGEYLDMTTLFEEQLSTKKLLVFPIREYWMDVGRIEDFSRAQEDYI